MVIMPPYVKLNMGFGCCFMVMGMMALGVVLASKELTKPKDVLSEAGSKLHVPSAFIVMSAQVDSLAFVLMFFIDMAIVGVFGV
jgi:hypothetical protein